MKFNVYTEIDIVFFFFMRFLLLCLIHANRPDFGCLVLHVSK